MKNIFIAIFATVILFASCKITTHVHFNKDNTGTVSIEYDYSQYLNESGGVDSTGLLDSMSESLRKLDTLGIMKRYKVEKTEKGILVSYAFDNLDQLNGSFNKFMDGDEEFVKTAGKFSGNRKKMNYELVNVAEKLQEDELVSSTDMDALFEWEFKVSYEQTIKKCSNENFTISDDKHSMSQKGGLSTFKDSKKMNFSVKLK
jgi:hypothetical protein